MRLKDRHAIVTGAAKGLGEAIARRFAAEGARVTCLDLDLGRAAAVADTLPDARADRVDVGSEPEVLAVIEAATADFGTPDIVANSAGIGLQRTALKTTVEDFETIYRVNVIGSFLFCREVAKRQIDAGMQGSLINLTSVAGLRGSAGRIAYGASKAAVINMTQVLANEMGRHRIRVNAIAPGPVETGMVKGMHTAETRATWAQTIPTREYGEPEDIADTALYLASDESRNVYGQVIAVDGGFASSGLIFDID